MSTFNACHIVFWNLLTLYNTTTSPQTDVA
jgi:hypothetical protein